MKQSNRVLKNSEKPPIVAMPMTPSITKIMAGIIANSFFFILIAFVSDKKEGKKAMSQINKRTHPAKTDAKYSSLWMSVKK